MNEPEIPYLPLGTYKHYKGKTYDVIGVGVDTETEKAVVIYVPLYESTVGFWVRPYDMFTDTLELDGKTIKRFEKV
jgi:hypothetical protein